MTPQNEPRPSKAERTAQAREQARQIREAHAKKEKRNGWLIRGGVLLAAVVVVVIVAVLIVQGTKKPADIAASGPVPANANIYGGVVQDKSGVVKNASPGEVDKATLPAAPTAAANGPATDLGSIGIAPSADGKPVQIVAYIDFICPACNQFETKFGPQLKEWQDSGKATIEYRAAGILDQFSTTNYSSRSAAASVCVADSSPEKYSAYFTELFAKQPAENSAGLSNDELKKMAKDVGAADISSCVDNSTYRPYIQYSTALSHAHGVNGTPTVFVDGKQYTDTTVPFNEFAQPIIDAKK